MFKIDHKDSEIVVTNDKGEKAVVKTSDLQFKKNEVKPTPRWGASYHIGYLFGGYDNKYLNEIWEYDTINNSWEKLKTTGDVPPGMVYASVFYDTAVNKFFVCSGPLSGGGWILDIKTLVWSKWF
jgi:hypothetical protein